ncbi:hypothetical protein Tco_1225444, partial [Tanacetum coccineum]
MVPMTPRSSWFNKSSVLLRAAEVDVDIFA